MGGGVGVNHHIATVDVFLRQRMGFFHVAIHQGVRRSLQKHLEVHQVAYLELGAIKTHTDVHAVGHVTVVRRVQRDLRRCRWRATAVFLLLHAKGSHAQASAQHRQHAKHRRRSAGIQAGDLRQCNPGCPIAHAVGCIKCATRPRRGRLAAIGTGPVSCGILHRHRQLHGLLRDGILVGVLRRRGICIVPGFFLLGQDFGRQTQGLLRHRCIWRCCGLLPQQGRRHPRFLGELLGAFGLRWVCFLSHGDRPSVFFDVLTGNGGAEKAAASNK